VLRIVAGELGGRRIAAPSGGRTRPTREVVREAWFSALGARIVGVRVVYLFVGSGALGIEAWSRGARHVDFVERAGRAVGVLRKNLEDLEIEDTCTVHREDVGHYLDAAAERGEVFDVALADPPYASDWARRLARRLRSRPFARLLCVEHGPGALEGETGVVWRRAYGDTLLSFLEPPDEADAKPETGTAPKSNPGDSPRETSGA
jgi:16S rRNA (guanine966-N2)-methyltransferase